MQRDRSYWACGRYCCKTESRDGKQEESHKQSGTKEITPHPIKENANLSAYEPAAQCAYLQKGLM